MRQANEQGLKFEDGKTNSLDIAGREEQNCLSMNERNGNEMELTLSGRKEMIISECCLQKDICCQLVMKKSERSGWKRKVEGVKKWKWE